MDELTHTFTGICLALDFRALLLTGSGAEEVAQKPNWKIAAQGDVDLHLGVMLFDRPFVFTPRSIITERNQTIEGVANVLEWLGDGAYSMPRSEVFGLNARGIESQIFAREIDVEASPIALLGHGHWVMAQVEIDPDKGSEITPIGKLSLPVRFRRALKVYRAGPRSNFEKMLD
ncbi:MAG TPA: hypothetical protein VFF70_03675 [Anaerolineae bacterium]|nr:hypothetical protein [Anaerolineae bacterium]